MRGRGEKRGEERRERERDGRVRREKETEEIERGV